MGKVQNFSCRRSNRLQKEPVVEQYLNPKQFLDGIDPVDIPMNLSLVLCSGNEENESKVMDYTSSTKVDAAELISDRFTGESHTSSRTANKSHNFKRRKCFIDVNYIDDTADKLDNMSGGKSVIDQAKTCTGNLADDLLCSNCQIRVANKFLLQCTSSSCSSAFHSFCLFPPIDKIEQDWLCPCCVGHSFTGKLGQNRRLIVKKVESVVGHKRNILGNEHNALQDLFLAKWQSFSHHYDSWVPFEWLIMVDRVRIRTYMKRYPLLNEGDTVDHRKLEWFRIDRVIACRNKHNSDEFCEPTNTWEAEKGNNDIEFLVKWMGLDYCSSTWESSHTEELLAEVDKFIERHQRAIHRIGALCHDSSKEVSYKTLNDVYGGTLYTYQLHGLNWILDSFKARKNVILAGKKIVLNFILMELKKCCNHPPTADRVVLYDPDFNPFMDLQAQSRAHRIGQNRPVVVYQLITKCTVEEKILHTSKKKLAIENSVMNPSKKPDADELQSILLHGSRTILNRKNVDATLICYDDNAIDNLLKLDQAPGERCAADETGYLGSIQSFNPESTTNPSTNMAKEWVNIFGPVPEKIMDEEFGRGKRKKKVVKIECEDHSDGDKPYSPPEGSASSSSSDDSGYEYDYHEIN